MAVKVLSKVLHILKIIILQHIHDMTLYYTSIAICMHVWARRKHIGRYTNATGLHVYIIIDIERIPCLGMHFMNATYIDVVTEDVGIKTPRV